MAAIAYPNMALFQPVSKVVASLYVPMGSDVSGGTLQERGLPLPV